MTLQFKKIRLYNFGSYADTEISLENKGFCLVSGENHCVSDNALSNGSGKTMIGSAICYALTGETISGLSKNLKNLNIDENLCFVTLTLAIDKNIYEITRQHKPKNDLKIIKNGVDLSGKGIVESKKALDKDLPDLTKDLISSIIILGQGLPNKFSSFSPSGRKELLEKLTKSDFMIEEVKTRLLKRQTEVNNLITNYENSALINLTNYNNTKNQLHALQQEYESTKAVDYETELAELNKLISQVSLQQQNTSTQLNTAEKQLETLAQNILDLTNKKSNDHASLNESYSNSISTKLAQKYKQEAELNSLLKEIKTLETITDICPTCKQKLPNVHKPDTTAQRIEYNNKKADLKNIETELQNAEVKYKNYQQEINNLYDTDIAKYQTESLQTKQLIEQLKKQKQQIDQQLNELNNKVLQINFIKTNYLNHLNKLEKQILETQSSINSLENTLSLIEQAKLELNEHVQILKKMETLIKRDFRGYLLTDIIKYIDYKAKEYCQLIFGTQDLLIELDGNALNIMYGNKAFDNLSGGEKQRCDIILQFALRDLLQTYLNYSSNILVLDEIFDNLDSLASSKIIDLINLKVKDVESIFVITHHPTELALPIDSEIHVVKNAAGISEIY